MTEEVVYYTDSTPPAAFTGSLRTAISGFSSGDTPLVRYALYEDSSTWDAWYEWSDQNAYNALARKKYSARALQMVGVWP